MQLSHRTASVGCVRLAAMPSAARPRCQRAATISMRVDSRNTRRRAMLRPTRRATTATAKVRATTIGTRPYVLRRLLELARRLRPDARCGTRLLRTSVHLPANVRSTASAANAAGGRHRNLWRGVPAVQPRCAAQSALRADGQHQGWAAVLLRRSATAAGRRTTSSSTTPHSPHAAPWARTARSP